MSLRCLALVFFSSLVAHGLHRDSGWRCRASDSFLSRVLTRSSLQCRPSRRRLRLPIRQSRIVTRTIAGSDRAARQRLLRFFHPAPIEE